MKENFTRCFLFVMRGHGDWKGEGGYVNNPRDPGGPTNMGITIATLSHEFGRRATAEDVRRMDASTAMRIYQKKYWNAVGADNLPIGVDLMIFDIAVNSGVGRALQFAKQTSSLLHPRERVVAIDKLRMGYFRSLRNWRFFGNGWKSREAACFALASDMVASLQGAPK